MRTWYPIAASGLLLIAVALIVVMALRVRAVTEAADDLKRDVQSYCDDFATDLKRSADHYRQSLEAIDKAPTEEKRRHAESRFDAVQHVPLLGGGSIGSRMGSSVLLRHRFNFCVATRALDGKSATQLRDSFAKQLSTFVESEDRAVIVSSVAELAAMAGSAAQLP